LPSCVVDTVILLYFLLAGEADLLLDTTGSPVGTPRIVYDPDEAGIPATTRSEITRSIAYHELAATDSARDTAARDLAAANTKRLRVVTELHRAGHFEVMDLTSTELEIFGKLASQNGCATYGLRFPLGYGEAACLAIALARSLPLATDDRDALRALHHVSTNHPYLRTRKLLILAAEREKISQAQANAVHQHMTSLGFWDAQLPFPGEHAGGS
jgi:predicted nucleic acid-binding protein